MCMSHHFVREQVVEFKQVKVLPIESAKNISDIGTKPLPAPAFERFLRVVMNLGDRSLRSPAATHPTPSGPKPPSDPEMDTLKPYETPKCARDHADVYSFKPPPKPVADISKLLQSATAAMATARAASAY